jgi:hypothetical protein
MLDFSQNINRIVRLSYQVTLDIEAKKYFVAKEHLNEIHAYTTAAQGQLLKIVKAKAQAEIEPEVDSP